MDISEATQHNMNKTTNVSKAEGDNSPMVGHGSASGQEHSHPFDKNTSIEKKSAQKDTLLAANHTLGMPPHKQNTGSSKSFVFDEDQMLHRHDYSVLDFSIAGMSAMHRDRRKMKLKDSKSRFNRTQMSQSVLGGQDGEEEVRQNKDLNTTYIQHTETVNPKKMRDYGCVASGTRTKINQYILLTQIGKGGWGEVFLSVDTNTKHKYALKVMNMTLLRSKVSTNVVEDSLRAEIAIQSSLNHPNIVKLIEALEHETSKKIYLVLEYCSMGALLSDTFWKAYREKNILDEVEPGYENKLPLYKAKQYFVQVVEGLNYLHNERSIVHRDIKPENILIDGNDCAKITDFGIALALGENESDQMFNQQWGTKMYLPPESWKSSLLADQDEETHAKCMDVWALGVTFYQMIYGTYPFKVGSKMQETSRSIIEDE